jgi:hypothetical protein
MPLVNSKRPDRMMTASARHSDMQCNLAWIADSRRAHRKLSGLSSGLPQTWEILHETSEWITNTLDLHPGRFALLPDTVPNADIIASGLFVGLYLKTKNKQNMTRLIIIVHLDRKSSCSYSLDFGCHALRRMFSCPSKNSCKILFPCSRCSTIDAHSSLCPIVILFSRSDEKLQQQPDLLCSRSFSVYMVIPI